jgi:carbon storage regulator
MLVIRRREGEAVLIGDGIEIEVVELTASRVKLGIKAPVEVLILRKEIRLAEQQNRAAARGVNAGALEDLVARLRPAPTATISSSR